MSAGADADLVDIIRLELCAARSLPDALLDDQLRHAFVLLLGQGVSPEGDDVLTGATDLARLAILAVDEAHPRNQHLGVNGVVEVDLPLLDDRLLVSGALLARDDLLHHEAHDAHGDLVVAAEVVARTDEPLRIESHPIEIADGETLAGRLESQDVGSAPA